MGVIESEAFAEWGCVRKTTENVSTTPSWILDKVSLSEWPSPNFWHRCVIVTSNLFLSLDSWKLSPNYLHPSAFLVRLTFSFVSNLCGPSPFVPFPPVLARPHHDHPVGDPPARGQEVPAMGQLPRKLQSSSRSNRRAVDLAVQGQSEETVDQNDQAQRLEKRSDVRECPPGGASTARDETERENAEVENCDDDYQPPRTHRGGRDPVWLWFLCAVPKAPLHHVWEMLL